MTTLPANRRQLACIPSPSPSAPSMADTLMSSVLPSPRLHRLVPGSQKEIAFINYIDSRILQISRRYAKKFSSDDADDGNGDEAPGYDDFSQVALDMNAVLDAVWISNTPTLQVPYLLSLAGLTAEYLHGFEFVLDAVATIVDKLDQAFAALLSPAALRQSETLHVVPGYRVSITDKVRIRSVIEETRVIAVTAASQSGMLLSSRENQASETEESSVQDSDSPAAESSLDIGVSRFYERSLTLLGDSLG